MSDKSVLKQTLAILDYVGSEARYAGELAHITVRVTHNEGEENFFQSFRDSFYEIGRSPSIATMVRHSDLKHIEFNLDTSPYGESREVRFGDAGWINIASASVNSHYKTIYGNYEKFTLTHALAHEVVHNLTDLDDGPLHNSRVNAVITELNAGTPRVDDYYDTYCFPAGTQITIWNSEMSLNTSKPIEQICVGDQVAALDKNGKLVPGKVTRLYQNSTDEWIKLSWRDGSEVRTLISTPGHHFLDTEGNYGRLDGMISEGVVQLVQSTGKVVTATAETIMFSEQTAQLFEIEETYGFVSGANAVAPLSVSKGWRTYNFEVELHHTYIAEGICVHNISGEAWAHDYEWKTHVSEIDGTAQTFYEHQVENYLGNGHSQQYSEQLARADTALAGGGSVAYTSSGRAINLNQTVFDDYYNNSGRGIADRASAAAAAAIANGATKLDAQAAAYNILQKNGVDVSEQNYATAQVHRAINNAQDGDYSGPRSGGGVSPSLASNPIQSIFEGVGKAIEAVVSGIANAIGSIISGIANAIGSLFGANNNDNSDGSGKNSPVVIDLDGDGIELAPMDQNQTFFDFDDDGYLERTAWVGADDGLLMFDLNNDGQISTAKEIALAQWAEDEQLSDMEALARFFDVNGDGKLDVNDQTFGADHELVLRGVVNANDNVWDSFKVWQDLDADAEIDEGELKTLAELNISEFTLSYKFNESFGLSDGTVVNGFFDVVMDGQTYLAGDVSLVYSTFGLKEETDADGNEIIHFEDGDVSANRILGSDDLTFDFGEDTEVWTSATGNDAANNITAALRTYDVRMRGGLGDDTLTGGAGNDLLIGDGGSDSLIGRAGDDILVVDADDSFVNIDGGDGYDTLVLQGDTGLTINADNLNVESVIGGSGNDTINGDDNNLSIYSEYASFDENGTPIAGDVPIGYQFDGGAGDDTLDGADNADRLIGGEGNDQLFGRKGDDFLIGNEGNDIIEGGAGVDILFGDAGDDILRGGDDEDLLIGGQGNDVLTGGAGADEFAPNLSSGETDTITDFNLSEDKLNFTEISAITSIDQLTISQSGNDAVVNFGDSQQILLANIEAIDLSKDHFIFDVFSDRTQGVERYSGALNYVFGSDELSEVDSADFTLATDNLEATDGLEAETYENDYAGAEAQSVNFNNSANIFTQGAQSTTQVLEQSFASGHPRIIDWTYNPNAQYTLGGFQNRGNMDMSINIDPNKAVTIITHQYPIFATWRTPDPVVGQISFNHRTVALHGAINLTSQDGNDYASTGAGNDIIRSGKGHDFIEGGDGNDQLFGEDGNDIITGGNGNDTIWGGTGDDSAQAGSGNDIIYGEDGQDILQGNAGDDTIYGGNADDSIYGGDGNDILNGGASHDFIDGGAGNDTLNGDAGDDVIIGGDGDDIINTMSGRDYAEGGNGNDQIYGGTGDNYIVAGSGNDIVHGNAGNDIIYGESGADQLDGGAGNDYVYAGGGNDSVIGGDGSDTVSGGSGDDNIKAGNGDDVIFAGAGDDYVEAGTGNDVIYGDLGNNWIHAGSGVDVVYGGTGDEIIYGGSGSDLIEGYSGSDLIYGGLNADDLKGGSGHDHIMGDEGNDTIDGGADSDLLEGGSGNDNMDGSFGNDKLLGDDGDDTLLGGAGNDILIGGSGADSLEGGVGNDLIFGGFDDSTTESSEHDTVVYKGNFSEFSFSTVLVNGITRIKVEDLSKSDLDEGIDELQDIDTVIFADQTKTFDELLVLASQPTNTAPVVQNILVDQSSPEDTAVSFAIPVETFSDVDGDTLTLSATLSDGSALPAWLSFDGTNFTGSPPQDYTGTLSIEVTANDGTDSVTDVFEVEIAAVNDAPVVATALVDQSSPEDTAVSFAIPPGTFSDVDGDTLALSATLSDGSALPAWLSFDGTNFTGSPPQDYTGTLSIEVTANDGTDSVTDVFEVEIAAVNDAPVVATALVDQSSPEDTAVSFAIPPGTFSDVDGDTLTLSATLSDGSALPAWLSFDGTNFTGSPPQDYTGTLSIEVTANDGTDSVTDVFEVEIAAVNDAPVVATALADQSSPEDTAVSFAIPPGTFSDVDGDTLTLSATLSDGSALPAWLSFDGTNFTGSPPQDYTGTLSIEVTANDGTDNVSDVFELVITPVGAPTPTLNTVTGTSDGDYLVGTDQNDHLIGLDGDDVFFETAGNDTYEGGSGYNQVNYDGASTDYTFVENSDGSVTATHTTTSKVDTLIEIGGLWFNSEGAWYGLESLTVPASTPPTPPTNNAPVVATALVDQSSPEDTAVSFAIPSGTFSDVDGDALTLSATLSDGSALPAWLSFDGTNFTGSPPQDYTGTLSIEVTASDGTDNVSDVFELVITPVGAPTPTLNTVTGTSDGDYLVGTDQDDHLIGLAGDDVFFETAGNDTYEGGSGYNQVNYDGASTDYTFVENSDGSVTATHTTTSKVDTLIEIGGLWFNSEGAWYGLESLTVPASTPPTPPTNNAPVVATALVDQSSPEDTAVSFAIPSGTFSDVDGDALTLSATLSDGSALPAWLSFDGTNFTGSPPQDYTGTLSIEVTASDGTDNVSDVFELVITQETNEINTIYGTVGDDTINGTISNDLIIGDQGSDIIIGSKGNDTIIGDGAGLPDEYNQVNYLGTGTVLNNFSFAANSDGSISVSSVQFGEDVYWGIDAIFFGEEAQVYTIDELLNPSQQQVQINTITGTSNGEYLDGTDEDDLIIGLGGDDVFYQTEGNDTFEGGTGYNQVNYDGYSSDFTFIENADGSVTATLHSNGKTDQLIDIGGIWFNGEGAWYGLDSLATQETSVNNNITSSSADETLNSTIGNDTFVFESTIGNDVIGGFTAGAGSNDVIEFKGMSDFDTFAEVLAATADDGADTTISLDANNSIILNNVVVADLHQDDFRFVS